MGFYPSENNFKYLTKAYQDLIEGTESDDLWEDLNEEEGEGWEQDVDCHFEGGSGATDPAGGSAAAQAKKSGGGGGDEGGVKQ